MSSGLKSLQVIGLLLITLRDIYSLSEITAEFRFSTLLSAEFVSSDLLFDMAVEELSV